MRPFAILHETKETQILIDTDYDHGENQFNLSIKFWSAQFNGYGTITLSWPDKDEKDFKRTFKKFKSREFAVEWIESFHKQFDKEEQ